MRPLTVTIITKDEAAHIGAAIDSAAWADEIVVVDCGSVDDTVMIARAKGARVETRAWTGWVDQKNYATSLASHDWIFSLDADERLTPALASEIRALLEAGPTRHGYRVPRVSFHLGKWIRTTDLYPDFQLRLYDRRFGRWRGGHVHESVSIDGPRGHLTNELLHYSYRDLRDQIERINHYTTLGARQMYENGQRAGIVDLAVQGPAAFLRNYILRRGILYGTTGLTLSIVNAWSVFLKFAKLWEMGRVNASNSQLPHSDSQPAETQAPTQPPSS